MLCLCRQLFASLDRCEAILGKRRYIAGDVLTEADLRLFQTLIRFDPVYVVRLSHSTEPQDQSPATCMGCSIFRDHSPMDLEGSGSLS